MKNYIDIRYHKFSGLDIWCGIIHFPNKEPMLLFSTIFSVKFHCEMEDTIVKFPFDKHSCILEVNCISVVFKTAVLIRTTLCHFEPNSLL